MNKMEYEEYWNKCADRVKDLFTQISFYVKTPVFEHKMLGKIACERATLNHSNDEWWKEKFSIYKVDENGSYHAFQTNVGYGHMIDILAFGSIENANKMVRSICKE